MTKEISGKAYVDQAPPIIAEITEMVIKGSAHRSEVMTVLHDTVRALKRATKRAETLSGEWERIEIKQTRGPVIEFTGKLLADDEFETRGRDPMKITLEIWETRGGALVAASYASPAGREGFEDARCAVIDPTDDAQAMRFAVLDFFEWDNRAKSMARKLGWNLRQEVE